MNVLYERFFDYNEWFILIGLLAVGLLIWKMPKQFAWTEGIAFFVFGTYSGMFFDHAISINPWDFYDVNDRSDYQLFDFLSYVLYGGFSYFFVYFYIKFKIKGFWNLGYMLGWTLISILFEMLGVQIKLYHFNKGYNDLYWSPILYPLMQSALIIFHHIVRREKPAKVK